MTKVQTNAYIDLALKEKAQKKGLNLSKIFEDALKKALELPETPEGIKEQKEIELKRLDMKREEISGYLTTLQLASKKMSEEETVALLSAKRRKKANIERDRYLNVDRNLYNITYKEVKMERKGNLPADDMKRYKLINDRFKKNYFSIHGVTP